MGDHLGIPPVVCISADLFAIVDSKVSFLPLVVSLKDRSAASKHDQPKAMTASLVASVAGCATQHAHADLDLSMLRAQHLIDDTF